MELASNQCCFSINFLTLDQITRTLEAQSNHIFETMSAYNHNKPPLPESYTPTQHDVVVGKGKKHFMHRGNIMLRNLVSAKLAEYSEAITKAGKSEIISNVVDHVNNKGAFIKRGPTGKWVYAEDRLCREKCSQT